MDPQFVIEQVRRLTRTELKNVIDASESVVVGTRHRQAAETAQAVLAWARTAHPDLLHSI